MYAPIWDLTFYLFVPILKKMWGLFIHFVRIVVFVSFYDVDDIQCLLSMYLLREKQFNIIKKKAFLRRYHSSMISVIYCSGVGFLLQ